MLTDNDKEFIKNYTESNKRYREVPIYAFKGRQSFDLHSKLINIKDDLLLNSFTDVMKNKCFLLVTIQLTTLNTVQKNQTDTSNKRVKLYFHYNYDITCSPRSYIANEGNKWLKILSKEPNNLL